MKNFALVGAAGYIAPRHLKAIRDTQNNLIAAVDKHDCVGVMDAFFPKAAFFVEFERFDRHVEKLRREKNTKLDYVSICTPNFMHDAHIRFALRAGADAICEKPLVLNPWNIDALAEIEKETGKKIYNVLQLRLHKTIIDFRDKMQALRGDKKIDVDLTYITSRGNWYYASWKGDISKSGGIATNIGVHFFDMLNWVFGDIQDSQVHVHTHDRASGYFEFEHARVRWFLSINADTLPAEVAAKGQRTYRSIKIGGEELEFSEGFTELHTETYKDILSGGGYGLEDARTAVEIVHGIRNTSPVGLKGDYHPFAALPLSAHPFH